MVERILGVEIVEFKGMFFHFSSIIIKFKFFFVNTNNISVFTSYVVAK
jgi:hypothetical protein